MPEPLRGRCGAGAGEVTSDRKKRTDHDLAHHQAVSARAAVAAARAAAARAAVAVARATATSAAARGAEGTTFATSGAPAPRAHPSPPERRGRHTVGVGTAQVRGGARGARSFAATAQRARWGRGARSQRRLGERVVGCFAGQGERAQLCSHSAAVCWAGQAHGARPLKQEGREPEGGAALSTRVPAVGRGGARSTGGGRDSRSLAAAEAARQRRRQREGAQPTKRAHEPTGR